MILNETGLSLLANLTLIVRQQEAEFPLVWDQLDLLPKIIVKESGAFISLVMIITKPALHVHVGIYELLKKHTRIKDSGKF